MTRRRPHPFVVVLGGRIHPGDAFRRQLTAHCAPFGAPSTEAFLWALSFIALSSTELSTSIWEGRFIR
jgi:hypothetical protein